MDLFSRLKEKKILLVDDDEWIDHPYPFMA
jgi:hypothetical protein